MRQRGDENLYIVLLTGLNIPLVGYGHPVLGFVVALTGSYVLVRKKYYSWTTIVCFFLVIIFFMNYKKPIPYYPLHIMIFFVASIPLEYGIHKFRTKSHLKRVLGKMGTDMSFELLPFNVNKYYRNLYSLQRPFMVRIWWKKNGAKEMDRGYFDLKRDNLIIEEPVLFPVYTGTPEKVWKNVVKTYHDGAPKKVEFRDKHELLVGIDVYEDKVRTSRSWRLNKSLYETWNPEKEEWDIQPRGWTPKKSFFSNN